MRIVVCDEDALLRDMIEAVVARVGHQIVGIANTSAAGVRLIETARPDAVIIDLALDFNSDFDIVASAIDVGARPIVFSHHGDAALLGRYEVHPSFVPKPDLNLLESVLARLDDHDRSDQDERVVERERRARPTRQAAGPIPTGVGDAQAFFEAVNEAEPGDALVSIEAGRAAPDLADGARPVLREGDRLLLFPTAVRFYLPGGDVDGVGSLVQRITHTGAFTRDSAVSSVVVADGEPGADAFDRLKRTPPDRP
jgi:chemotaxis response regulator CheB